jgi:hypothetical protein
MMFRTVSVKVLQLCAYVMALARERNIIKQTSAKNGLGGKTAFWEL